MKKTTFLSLLTLVFVASLVSACGSSKKAPLVISVQIAPAPPAALEVSHSIQLSAQTVNDTAAAGVDWTLSCTSSDCGSIMPAHTDNGAATTYTAPATVPTGGSVTVTATSTTDPTQSASATITINPQGSNAGLMGCSATVTDCQYAFFVTGVDANGFYSAAGSFTSNGDGTLADGGEEDFNDPGVLAEGDTLTDGTYNIGPDGRGTISFTANFQGTPDTLLPNGGMQTFNIVATSDFVNTGTHLLIVEASAGAASSGVVDLQSSGDFAGGLTGSYVFTLTGQDAFNGLVPATFGGVANTDGNGNITGVIDENDFGDDIPGTSLAGATYTAPDANGRGTIALNNADAQTYTYYMVNAGVLRVVETDDTNFFFIAGGSAYIAASGTAFDTTALSGNFVFVDNGQSTLGPIGLGGQVVLDGAGNITSGVDDFSEGGAITSAAPVTGTYSVPDPTVPRVVFAITGGNSGDVANVYAYLSDPSVNFLDPRNGVPASGALLMDSDPDANGTGLVVEQAPTSASTFAGNYAFNFQLNAQFNELDVTGAAFSDGTANFTGTADLSAIGFGTDNGDTFVATFAADTANPGRITASEVDTTVFGALDLDLALYQISSDQLISIGLTSNNITVGTLVSQ